ncbi:uncharacterized protein BO66DRAFT_394808 [Aspergillus aculeatinus CBS 121060]|uniref:Uncharacterized protein n=1 Tax=Aspergillus aculeatinus CBS 121060 TaxID=1448322 RepID=A0ACD1GYE7_9EURO|nr:hypothetical protein BO66DRAFT_394808 [Aspergillus aculeatinus CBS 121060]RAH66297.1 hypothetical protein BO66DRAFT_394808 [Aspergillus aculeatinus CBS 121060]
MSPTRSAAKGESAGFHAGLNPRLAQDLLQKHKWGVALTALLRALQGMKLRPRYPGPQERTDFTGGYAFGVIPPAGTRTLQGECWLLDQAHAERIAEVVGDDDGDDDDGRNARIKCRIMWDSRQAFDHWLTSSPATDQKTENAFFHISGRPKSGKSQLIREIFFQKPSDEVRQRLQLEWCSSPAKKKEKKLVMGCVSFYDYSEEFGPDGLKTMMRGILWALIQADEQLAPLLFPLRYEYEEDEEPETKPRRRSRSKVLKKLARATTPRRCWKKKNKDDDDDDDDEAKGEEEIEHRATPKALPPPIWPLFSLEDSELFVAWNRLSASNKIWADRKIFLLLDGINRFDEGEHGQMLTALKDWVRARPGHVKICITSRGEAAFQEALESQPGFILHDANFLDQLWYTRHRLTTSCYSRLPYTTDFTPAEQIRIEYDLVRLAGGNDQKLCKMVRLLEQAFRERISKDWIYLRLEHITGRPGQCLQ